VNGMALMSCDDMCVTFVHACVMQSNTTRLRLFHYYITTCVSTCDTLKDSLCNSFTSN
jgi:hypothetical protein